MRIAIIGKGRVGRALGPRFAAAGHDVEYGVRDPFDPRHANDDGIPLATTGEAARAAEVIVLAIMWGGLEEALAEMGELEGKILIDPINALDFENDLKPLVDGNTSVAEIIQSRTHATVVKTLNQVGSPVMEAAGTLSERPIQFVAADDARAKATVMTLVEDVGFRAIDAGPLAYARELEALAKLWISQAFGHGMVPTAAWRLD